MNPTAITIPSKLDELSNHRTGGIYNIRGIDYQILYTVNKLLKEFNTLNATEKCFQLEGVEDLDLYILTHKGLINEHIQVKCKGDLGADDFVKDILNNLLEVYDIETNSRFTIISNTHAKGKLNHLFAANKHQKPMPKNAEIYWNEKVMAVRPNYSSNQVTDFLKRIYFELKKYDDLEQECYRYLIDYYQVINGNEPLFFKVLLQAIKTLSLEKSKIYKYHVDAVVQAIQDDIHKGATNEAIRRGWIQRVDFSLPPNGIDHSYFEGKAARPIHIAANLPVERLEWAQQILKNFDKFEVLVIKASSGQGKSTLAWQTAQTMSQQGYDVYELSFLDDAHLQDVVRFMESRLKLHLLPLLVIDGLNENLKDWYQLAQKLRHIGMVKILVTTREEDWFRYAKQLSQMNFKTIEVYLSEKEAEKIYFAFLKQRKIHLNIKSWRSAWEKVRGAKLLIEYVYLLTQGQMLHERMLEQIQNFDKDPNALLKKRILRLITVADMLHIKLSATPFYDYLENKIGDSEDLPVLLQSLKNEYHIQINNNYLSGLHPIRSTHIAHILHDSLPMIKTLTELLSVIEPQFMEVFVSNAGQFIAQQSDKNRFFQKLATFIAAKPYTEIVDAIYGVFATDAHAHRHINQVMYDKIGQQNNGALLVYIMPKIPFSGIEEHSLDVLTSINPKIQENLDNIKAFDVENSNVAYFLRYLNALLAEQPIKPVLKGMASIDRWLQRFGLRLTQFRQLTLNDLDTCVKNLNIKDLGEIIYGFFLLELPIMSSFFEKYEQVLINKFKVETNTLFVKTSKQEIKIRYLIDNSKNINTQSVDRVHLIGYCLPYFESFDIKGVYFPNPVTQFYTQQVDDSVKKSKLQGWLKSDDFTTRGNRVWIDQIQNCYKFFTLYDWLKYWVDYRFKMIEWMKQICKWLECHIAGSKDSKKESLKWDLLHREMFEYAKGNREIPYDDAFTENLIEKPLKEWKEWEHAIQNVVNHRFPSIDNEDAKRHYKVQAQAAFKNLPLMHNAFKDFCLKTAHSFEDLVLLEQNELNTYEYFADLIIYFLDEYMKKFTSIDTPRNAVKVWKEAKWQKELELLEDIKFFFELRTNYYLVLPDAMLADSDYLVIGIKNIAPTIPQEELGYLLMQLSDLVKSNAHFFYILLIDNDIEVNPIGFRLSKSFLRALNGELEEDGSTPTGGFFPVEVTEKLLGPLHGVVLKKTTQTENNQKAIYLKLHELLWRYSEILIHIDFKNPMLKKWGDELLQNLRLSIYENRSLLQENTPFFDKYQKLIDKVIRGKLKFDESQCHKYWNEDCI